MNLEEFSNSLFDEVCSLHRELCVIPAPSHFEDKRAEYILNYLIIFKELLLLQNIVKTAVQLFSMVQDSV